MKTGKILIVLVIIAAVLYGIILDPWFVFRSNRIIITNMFYDTQLELSMEERENLLDELGKPAVLLPILSPLKSEFYIRIDFYHGDEILRSFRAVEDINVVNMSYGMQCRVRRGFKDALVEIMKKHEMPFH